MTEATEKFAREVIATLSATSPMHDLLAALDATRARLAAVEGGAKRMTAALETMRAHFSCSPQVRALHDADMALRIIERALTPSTPTQETE